MAYCMYLRVGLDGLDGVILVVRRASRARKMVHLVHLQHDGLYHVVIHQREVGVA